MTMMVWIETLSWTVIGTRSTSSGAVDLDTVRDDDGLPYIPRSVLTSRIRDAALVALTRPRPEGASDTWLRDRVSAMTDVMGTARSTGHRLMYLGDATLPAGYRRRVHEELRSYTDHGLGTWYLERCLDLHTEVRTQTAADHLGAPVAGSLRQTRGVVPGRTFFAPVNWRREPEPKHLAALAEMLACLSQVGSGATSGSGRVRCSLDGDPAETSEWARMMDEN